MKHFNLKKFSLTAFLIMLALLLTVSCDMAQEEETVTAITDFIDVPETLIGTWEAVTSTYTESYTITNNTFSSAGAYEGNTVKVFKTSETSGYIYIKYTKAAMPDWTYSENAPDVGKWYAISYKELRASSVKLAGAFKASEAGGKTSTETIEEAKAEFTVENGYFNLYSELTKRQ